MRRRVSARQREQADASEAGVDVLEHQLRHYRPLDTAAGDAMILPTGSDAAALHRLLGTLRALQAVK